MARNGAGPAHHHRTIQGVTTLIRTFIVAVVVAAAAIGAAPAASAQQPYPNCKTAAQDGVYNIPSDSPYYGPWLDKDSDGVGCES